MTVETFTARVLIVEDDHDTADSLAILLGLWGHETRKAFDGGSVLQQALAFHPHLVLLDIGLPKLDGYAVARRLRQYKALAGIQIIAVSGFATPTDVKKCAEAGCDGFFQKPIDPDRLKAYLESLAD